MRPWRSITKYVKLCYAGGWAGRAPGG
jgi:hypothetical protein